MKLPPIAIIGGLVAVGAAVMFATSKASAAKAEPLPVDPAIPPGGGGGPGLQVDPSRPFDCQATLTTLQTWKAAIDKASLACKTNPKDPSCASIPGWSQTYMATLADYGAHGCDTPGIDCGTLSTQVRKMQDDIAATVKACAQNPNLPACAAIPSWQQSMGPILDQWRASCGQSSQAAESECSQLLGWIQAVSPSGTALGNACQQGDQAACASFNQLVTQVAAAQQDYQTHCGPLPA